MDKLSGSLRIMFEDPFWIGIFERTSQGKLKVSKVTFGAEPKDYEVWEFVLQNYYRLQFSPAVTVQEKELSKNPKRALREAKAQTKDIGIGTKSQQALKQMQEANKLEKKAVSKEQKEAEKQLQFELKQQKRKEKHRGR